MTTAIELLQEHLDSLGSAPHPEKIGLVRAIELLRVYDTPETTEAERAAQVIGDVLDQADRR